MYNLIYSIIIRPIFQEVHNFLQFARVSLIRLHLFSIIYIILHIIVNPAGCTKNMFYFSLMHIIHNIPTGHTHDLCTPFFVCFSAKSSYTPIYPHYPQFFSVSRRRSTFLSPPAIFCILVINFTISAKNTPFLLDKKMPKSFVG